jgi:regulator of replication initiation timing
MEFKILSAAELSELLSELLKENEKLNKENEELKQSLESKEKETIETDVYIISYSSYMCQLLAEEKIKVVKANMEIDELRKYNSTIDKHVDDLLELNRAVNTNNDNLVKELKNSNNKIEYFKNVVKNNMENLEQMDQKLVNLVCKVKLLFDVWESGKLTKSSDIYTTTKELVLKLYNENTADEISVEKVIEPEKPKFIAGNDLIPGISILSVIQQNKRTILNVRESKYGMSKTINATNYHMCEDCKSCFPECDGKEIAFGDSPNGSDNVIACNGYKPYEKGEKHEK